ncbi:MAG TPA: hypothetical protein VF608_09130, partial [Thermoanaerobaculia bacterium]
VAPLFASIRNAAIVTSLAIVCAIIEILSPTYTLAKPQRLSLLYVDDPAAPAPRWITPVMTRQLRDAAKFDALDTSITPWNTAAGWSSIAPQQNLPRPIITREDIAGGVRIRVRTQRAVNRITLLYRGDGTIQRVNGTPLPPKSARFRERNNDWKYASASAATELVVDVAGTVTEVVASDVSHGLPGAGAALMKAREASCAVPSHEGDLTIVRARQSTK